MNQPSSQRAVHWEQVYQSKKDAETSWFQDEPRLSLELISTYAPKGARVVDIGGGASVLAGRLVEMGFDVTVLDISAAALERAKARIGERASAVKWIVGDVTQIAALGGPCDVWHDRAVFHFLTDESDRRSYTELAAQTVVTGGFLIIGTFAVDGPEKCSGLAVERYDDRKLLDAFSPAFTVVRSLRDTHVTPWGKPQAFLFAVLLRI